MLKCLLLCLVWTTCLAFPDAAISYGGFQPLPDARGVPNGHLLPKGPTHSPKRRRSGIPYQANPHFYGNSFGNNAGAFSEPTATFYVNVPQQTYPPLKPIAAGPPRKHYRIVFIRSPNPPRVQQILPPKVEQKTLIYVLHPKRQNQKQAIVEVPSVTHDPQVYFVQYDNEPPTAADLQDLVKNTLDSGSPTLGGANFNFGGGNKFKESISSPSPSFGGGAPAPANVYPPGTGESFLNKRGTVQKAKTLKSSANIAKPSVSRQRPTKSKERATSSGNRKRPPFIPSRASSKRIVPALSSPFNTQVRKRFSRNPSTDPFAPSPDFKQAFKTDFSFPSFSFGGKLKNKKREETQKVEEKS